MNIEYIVTIATSLFVSEILPFLRTDSNGILHMIYLIARSVFRVAENETRIIVESQQNPDQPVSTAQARE